MHRDTLPTNAALMARRKTAVARGVGQAHEIFVARARHAELWDVEGRRYIDFAGGIAVVNTGHCHPDVIAAVKAQLDLYTHTCFQVVAYEPYVELAERLNALQFLTIRHYLSFVFFALVALLLVIAIWS